MHNWLSGSVYDTATSFVGENPERKGKRGGRRGRENGVRGDHDKRTGIYQSEPILAI